jgi:hypothetical protein
MPEWDQKHPAQSWHTTIEICVRAAIRRKRQSAYGGAGGTQSQIYSIAYLCHTPLFIEHCLAILFSLQTSCSNGKIQEHNKLFC